MNLIYLFFFSCLFIKLALSYHVFGGEYFSETEICNQFKTDVASDVFQLVAKSLDNETLSPYDVQVACGVSEFEIGNGFELYLTSYPSVVRYEVEINPITSNNTYRITLIGFWGDLFSSPRVECDYDGNAFFVLPGSSSRHLPQSIVTVDWIPDKTLNLQDSFELDFGGVQHGTSPVFGEGIEITTVACRIHPEASEKDQKVWIPSQDFKFDATLRMEILSWWGSLHPEMWAELILLAVIAIPKFLLVVWFLYKCRVFQDHVMMQQRLFLNVSIFSFLASLSFLIFLSVANMDGSDTCCPSPPPTIFFLGLKAMASMAFDLLVLATSKGWGVVHPKLDAKDQRRIFMFFFISLVIYIISRISGNIQMSWILVINETAIWLWIFSSLRQTIYDLQISGRLDRHAKLEMYFRLRSLLFVCLGLWCLIILLEIWVIVIVYNQSGRIVIFDIPPTLAWDLSLLAMMTGFAYIWRPSPATAQFSYIGTRQEEDSFDLRSDPITEFGVDSS